MRNLKSLLALVFLLIISSSFTYSQKSTESGKKEWKMVWNDEFNGKVLDLTKWNVLTRETSKHNELQYYVPDDVYLENGCLRIRSRVRDFGNKHFTSGRLDTKDKLA